MGRRRSDSSATPPDILETSSLYLHSARRTIRRYGISPARIVRTLDDRPVFVVGSPRSGTSFTAATIGTVGGFADLGELHPLKRLIPVLAAEPTNAAAKRIRGILSRAQRLGQVAGLRAIEQTPESTFLIPAIASALPDSKFLHLVRDGRDVAASLLGLGWLRSRPDRTVVDEVGHALDEQTRFWVESERAAEFPTASEATRAAWVWRRYETTARAHLAGLPGRAFEIRYERLVADPAAVSHELAAFLDVPDQAQEFAGAFAGTVTTAQGRWRKDLAPDQLDDVLAEAGAVLADLGYC